jgi:predicted TIM-barrel fold metal-dependent hydrolase
VIIDAHSHLGDPALCERLNLHLPASMLNTDALLQEQARSGVERSVVSGPRIMEAALQAGLDAASAMRTYHEYIANVVAKHPRNLSALGIAYPMGDDAVLTEMERAVTKLGLRGFIVVPRYENEFLDSPRASEFFALCEKLGAVVFVHSADGCLASEHLRENRLVELVGRPNEMTICAARLIMAGHMERFPKLKILFARLGGAITLYAGRIENGWETRHSRSDGVPPWGPDNLKESFMHSLRRIHVDTQTFHAPAVRCAVETLGHERVLFGSDFPPVPRPLAASIDDVRSAGISPAAVTAVLGSNAERLFGLTASP